MKILRKIINYAMEFIINLAAFCLFARRNIINDKLYGINNLIE